MQWKLSLLLYQDVPTIATEILRERDERKKLSIVLELTEPAFFLPEATGNRPVVLRGRCTLIVKRRLQVEQVIVTLDGFSTREWPNGKCQMRSIVKCPLTLLSKNESKSQVQFLANEPEKLVTDAKEVEVPQKRFKKLRQMVDKFHLHSRKIGPDVKSKCFLPGSYCYDFEMILRSNLPESTFVEGAVVRYHLKASVKCKSMQRKFYQQKEIEAVRCPADAYVEDSEAISRPVPLPGVMNFDISLARKGIALEDLLPVSFKYKGYNDTKFHNLRVFLAEDVINYMPDGTRAGKARRKKYLLHETRGEDLGPEVHQQPEGEVQEEELNTFEAKSTRSPMSPNNCNTPDRETIPSSHTIHLDINLQMPKCKSHSCAPDFKFMHFDAKLENVEVKHFLEFWVYVFIDNNPTPKSFTHPVPLALRSCYAHAGNAALPAYFEELLPDYSSLSGDAPVSTIDHDG
ncbi:uncharacterized protein CDV56_106790 [Aspergillus thermomutatus]|uniref:Arrestin C-terminal-like domain-containing protein n=1 Tax=Aspergillus thermomutatus TaxID=41047 RepID=A0A397H8M2_ASPTH|nr:uncharacterized protein CDV56_106790 [Aspergillus thermomutatus]RHZ59445.1 hypothetical protein CDV56_106790 [Aspergillus thermomutatus]